ncbi:MAG: carbohydrate ABC transporter permease [Anaerolineae bacterium]|jgi:multiple sugar transport system permease protein|nr:carbohydrate ABC transporter permease [Anaerolineae bacterium]
MKWRRVTRSITYAVLVAGAIGFLIPLFWAISASLKPDYQVLAVPPKWIPDPVMWENYPAAMTYVPFGRYILNTLWVAAWATLGSLLSCTIVAYGFARLNAPGKKFLFILMLSSMMLVEPVRIIPLYIEFNALGWTNSYLPLIVPAFFGSPFYIFLLRQFFMNIPKQLEEAALLDGANRWQILTRIILPLTRPALAAVAIFQFQGVWNDFLQPLIFLADQRKFTVSLGLNFFRAGYDTQWAQLMAASIISLIPILVLFFFAQKQFIQGISMGGIKE